MAFTTQNQDAKRPRRTLARGILKGRLIGGALGLMAAMIIILGLVAVQPTDALALEALLYLGLEAGLAGAILGGLIAGLSRLRNTR
ncbi:hypothetical protein [Hyphobacterium sp.]|uniref:hypothetical protein n=1 Tax=Hyphobacterium sp. TaxID=2004662 RepID=UPI0037494C77